MIMNRIEILRQYIDKVLLNMEDDEERRCAYIHLYGVAQACTLIALKRGINVELATIAGMLHDIYTYAKMDPREHAHKGATLSKEILTSLQITNEDETDMICNAIYTHSEKELMHDDFNEVLIDADVLAHCLYNPKFEIMPNEKSRYEKLKIEFGI
jgi:HD superfamily phosphodiesterase